MVEERDEGYLSISLRKIEFVFAALRLILHLLLALQRTPPPIRASGMFAEDLDSS